MAMITEGERIARDITPWSIGGLRAPVGRVELGPSGLFFRTDEAGRNEHHICAGEWDDDGFFITRDGYRFKRLPDGYRDGDKVDGCEDDRAFM